MRPDTRPGLDLAIHAVERRQREARTASKSSMARKFDAFRHEANGALELCDAILADLHALRQEAGE